MNNLSKGKILVIRGGAIGDLILTLPVLAALREHFPAAHLEVLGYPHIAGLALAGGLVDRVRAVEHRGFAGFFAPGVEPAAELAEYFGSFAVILSYLYDPDGIFQTNVKRFTRAQFIAGPHRPDEKLNLHAAEVFLRPLERLAIFNADPVPRLDLAKAFRPSAKSGASVIPDDGLPAKRSSTVSEGWRNARPSLALHPGSGSAKKNWPAEKWAGLLQHLANQTRLNLVLVGGEAEGERLAQFESQLPAGRVEVLQGLPLVELAARLSRCSSYVGHDSGISHLASALGLRGLLLWGESNETIWRPPGPNMRILRDPEGLTGLPVDRVAEELAAWLGTS